MSGAGFASLPAPPYFAVIFSSQRIGPDAGYSAMADRMVELAATQPGYLGLETCRGEDGFGITVSYWRNEADILAWKRQAEHSLARRQFHAFSRLVAKTPCYRLHFGADYKDLPQLVGPLLDPDGV